jgi:hypothetical protein
MFSTFYNGETDWSPDSVKHLCNNYELHLLCDLESSLQQLIDTDSQLNWLTQLNFEKFYEIYYDSLQDASNIISTLVDKEYELFSRMLNMCNQ